MPTRVRFKPMFYVMYNNRIGGFGLSNAAIKLYNQRKPEDAPDVSEAGYASGRDLDRTDPVMVQVVRELGDKTNTAFSRICLEELPDEYKGFYSIDEFEGAETVRIEHDKYSLHRIEEIMKDPELCAEDKITQTMWEIKDNRDRQDDSRARA